MVVRCLMPFPWRKWFVFSPSQRCQPSVLSPTHTGPSVRQHIMAACEVRLFIPQPEREEETRTRSQSPLPPAMPHLNKVSRTSQISIIQLETKPTTSEHSFKPHEKDWLSRFVFNYSNACIMAFHCFNPWFPKDHWWSWLRICDCHLLATCGLKSFVPVFIELLPYCLVFKGFCVSIQAMY